MLIRSISQGVRFDWSEKVLDPSFNESRSRSRSRSLTTMAEVLPQIRLRADTQSREASSNVESPTILPLKDATNNVGNGRVTSPESVEGKTPSLLPGVSNMGRPTTATKMLAELLTLLFQHDNYQTPKAIQASSCRPSQVIRRMPRPSLPPGRNEEIHKQLTLYHTYVMKCLNMASSNFLR